MDVTQIVVISSIIAVSLVIIAAGVWFILLLKEVRVSVIKANTILDDAKLITQSVVEPVSTISDFVSGIKSGLKIFNSMFGKKDGKW